MKNKTAKLLFALVILGSADLFAQKLNKGSSWTLKDPFEHSLFIENKGQFTGPENETGIDPVMALDIKYFLFKEGVAIYFTPGGLTYRHDEIDAKDKEKSERRERKLEKRGEHGDDLKVKVDHQYFRMIWEGSDVPDAIQNAVLRAFRAFDRYHDGTNFRAWMFRILTNEIFSLNRKRGRIAQFEISVEPEEMEAIVALERAAEYTDWLTSPHALTDALD